MEEGKGTPLMAPAQGAAISNRLFELRDDVLHIQVGGYATELHTDPAREFI